MSDVASGSGKRSDESRLGGGGLRIYKAGQGYYTRIGTAIGAGILALWGSVFVYGQVQQHISTTSSYFLPVAYGTSVGFLVVISGVVYWAVGLSRKVNDFFIATEGEMKKVSWSTWTEVKRSTAVVIISVVLLGIFLFAVDILFILIFRTLQVLKFAPLPWELFGNQT